MLTRNHLRYLICVIWLVWFQTFSKNIGRVFLVRCLLLRDSLLLDDSSTFSHSVLLFHFPMHWILWLPCRLEADTQLFPGPVSFLVFLGIVVKQIPKSITHWFLFLLRLFGNAFAVIRCSFTSLWRWYSDNPSHKVGDILSDFTSRWRK